MTTWVRRKAQLERLESELAEQIERADRAEADREGLRTACDQAQEELVAAEQRAEHLTVAHAEVTAGLTQRAEVAEGRVAQLRSLLTTKDAELAAAGTAVDDLTTRLAGLQASLDNKQSELATARDVLAAERDHARQQLTTAREQARRADAEHADQVRTLTRRVEETANRAQELGSRLERADAELVSVRCEADRVQALLQQRTDEATSMAAGASGIAEQKTELRGQLSPPQLQHIDTEAAAPHTESTPRPDQPTEPEPPSEPEQPPTNASSPDQPSRSPSPQRQQPSRRRRSRPAKG
jgi:chromosome segregation ATPase